MFTFYVIGAGSLGSCFAIEAARRAAASKIPATLYIYDFDIIEDRNVYSQDFLPEHIGKYKADVVADICNQYSNITAVPLVEKWDLDTKINEKGILVDCVDNIPTRQNIWLKAKGLQFPSLHLGMSLQGHGLVEWSYQDHDTFSLGINDLNLDLLLEQPKEQKKPPCYMNSQRPLIVQTALAGVTSAFIFFGHDPGDLLTKDDTRLDFPGMMMNWSTSNSHGTESLIHYLEYTP